MTTIHKLQADSATLRQVFGWFFGVGLFLVFSEIAYMPLKAVVMSFGTDQVWDALRQLGERSTVALPSLAMLGALWQARQLFASFAEGEIVSPLAARALTRLGDWLVAAAICSFAIGPAGDKANAMFGLYLGQIVMLGCIGLGIRLIGRVVDMAAAIKADNDQIV